MDALNIPNNVKDQLECIYMIMPEDYDPDSNKREGMFLMVIKENVFGKEVYPSIEEKAANLLYFFVKDHIFVDGNKRIAALLYLAFLHKNGMLIKEDGGLRISNDGLAALTILIAESKPREKEVMVAVTMNMTGK